MLRVAIAIAAGFLIGAALTYRLTADTPETTSLPAERWPALERDLMAIPRMATAEAEAHREDRFERIRSIADTLALPGDFSQTEALYVLAGRSDAEGVRELLDEANRIADPTDRNAALSILFLRLAEVDPRSALTLSRQRRYTSGRHLEAAIWRSWSKLDLDAAIAAARAIGNTADRSFAAQTMLAAFGYTGNEVTERIEAELGVGVNAQARGQYLMSLADRSVPEAIEYLNALPREQRQEGVNWLARYLSQRNPGEALGYADLIDGNSLRQRYRLLVNRAVAQREPEQVLQSMPAHVTRSPDSNRYYAAMNALARTDIDRALMYYESLSSQTARQAFANIIGTELARQDPERAIAWAQAQQRGPGSRMLRNVLAQVAISDPELAMAEIGQIDSRHLRQQTLSQVLSAVARDDPQQALVYLDQMNDPRDREAAAETIVGQWARSDPEAAVNWLLASDAPRAQRLPRQTGFAIVNNDVDAAIRLLPRVDERTAAEWRLMIPGELARQRGAADAQRFVDGFRDTPEFPQMQMSLIAGVARDDAYAALDLIDLLPTAAERDAGYSALISQYVYQAPEEAAGWVDAIGDEQQRGQIMGQVLGQWYQSEPSAALRWIRAQPAGPDRDSAILRTSGYFREGGQDYEGLLTLIDNPDVRRQAQLDRVRMLAGRDLSAAYRLLDETDMPAEERQRLEAELAARRR